MSQLVPCVLLLVVEVLLGCVAAAVLDSASVSVGSLCIVVGSRGPAGVYCCSSTGFHLCLSWLPVHRCWQYRPAGLELLQQYWIRLLSQLPVPVLVAWVSWAAVKVLKWPVRSLPCFQTV